MRLAEDERGFLRSEIERLESAVKEEQVRPPSPLAPRSLVWASVWRGETMEVWGWATRREDTWHGVLHIVWHGLQISRFEVTLQLEASDHECQSLKKEIEVLKVEREGLQAMLADVGPWPWRAAHRILRHSSYCGLLLPLPDPSFVRILRIETCTAVGPCPHALPGWLAEHPTRRRVEPILLAATGTEVRGSHVHQSEYEQTVSELFALRRETQSAQEATVRWGRTFLFCALPSPMRRLCPTRHARNASWRCVCKWRPNSKASSTASCRRCASKCPSCG